MFLAELSKENQDNYLRLAYAAADADGKITEEELSTLNMYKAEIPGMSDITEYKISDISEPIKALGALDKAAKKKVYFELISLVLTDLDYSEEEKVIVEKVVSGFGLGNAECQKLDDTAMELIKLLKRVGVLINE